MILNMQRGDSKEAVLIAVLVWCLFLRCAAVFQDVDTVTTARCYANCITKVSTSSLPDVGCHGNACSQCVTPCSRPFTTLSQCAATCKNSSICKQSCQFLAALKNRTNVFDGTNTITTKPGVAIATAKNITSLTLSWKPATSAGGSVVYMLKKRFTGDLTGPLADLRNLVFTEPRAVIGIRVVCLYMPRRRRKWDGLKFFFKVVAVTEQSQLAESKESQAIEMTRPDPVARIRITELSYDAKSIGDKLKLKTVVTPPPGQVSLISQYAMAWHMAFCKPFVVPRTSTSKGASTSITMHIYQNLKACKHTIKVYSLIQCIPSLPKQLTYDYQGCRSVGNFNKSLCHSFDPPPTPDSARAVRNLGYSPLQLTNDLRYNTHVTWLPPTFPFGKVQTYVFAYGDVNRLFLGRFWIATRGSTKGTSLSVQNVLPNITVRAEIQPSFPNAVGVVRKITFRTAAIPQSQIIVHNVQSEDFVFSPSVSFSVCVRWESPPAAKRGIVAGYLIEFVKGNDSEKTITTNKTSHVFDHLTHNESLMVEIKPLYKQAWIKPNQVVIQLRAPVPSREYLTIKYLAVNEFVHEGVSFTAHLSWEPPTFHLVPVDYYEIRYSLIGQSENKVTCPQKNKNVTKNTPCMPGTTKETFYRITGVGPQQYLVIMIKPVFKDSPFIEGTVVTLTTNAPRSVCEQLVDGYQADPRNCAAFYLCSHRVQTFHMICPLGLYWNDEKKTCDWPRNVNCHDDSNMFCTNRTTGYYRDQRDRFAYYYCDDKGNTFRVLCPHAFYWNQQKMACDWPNNGN